MEIFIPDLKNAGGRFLEYQGEIKVKDPEIKPSQNDAPVVKIFLKAAYINNRVIIKGSWKSELTGECSRCLEQTSYILEESFNEEFVQLQAGESAKTYCYDKEKEEQYLFKGELLSLDEYFQHSFFISQPLKILCRENCKGLCPVCGQNRNKSLCSCTDEQIDYRWSALEKLRQ